MNGRETTSTAIPTPFDPIQGKLTNEKVNTALAQQYQAAFNVFGGLVSEQRKLLAEIENLKLKIDEFEKIQKDSTFRMMEIVGIFTALLGFIAFEAQIFKGPLTTLTLVGLSSLMLGALTFFALLLDLAFDGFKTKRNLRFALFGFSVTCVLAGFVAAKEGYKNGDYKMYLTEDEVAKEIEEQINKIPNTATTSDTNVNNNISTELLEFKNCILKQGLARCL